MQTLSVSSFHPQTLFTLLLKDCAIPASRNITCIPELGLFEVHDSLRNFSAALTACSNGSGTSLAHVISEDRTNGFADLMRAKFSNKKLKVRAAYVGLNYSSTSKEFQTTKTKENLLCYTYRAWAPGYPR